MEREVYEVEERLPCRVALDGRQYQPPPPYEEQGVKQGTAAQAQPSGPFLSRQQQVAQTSPPKLRVRWRFRGRQIQPRARVILVVLGKYDPTAITDRIPTILLGTAFGTLHWSITGVRPPASQTRNQSCFSTMSGTAGLSEVETIPIIVVNWRHGQPPKRKSSGAYISEMLPSR